MDKLSVDTASATTSVAEMEERIINDVKQMDLDTFTALIEFMYHVKAEINPDSEIEEISIKVDDSLGFKTLKEIF
ncbi:MAG TPA: hypothetical protein VIH28_06960 [Ignavibacteriaceae bacterium]